MKAVALLVAAGSGERLGAQRPKAFVVVGGKPMLAWSLETLQRVPGLSEIVVALPPNTQLGTGAATSEALAAAVQEPPRVRGVPGGATRSHSVRNALAAAPDAELVVVHDAARPLAEPELFSRTLAALDEADAAIAATPVTDTIKEAEGARVVSTLDRSHLWAVQTPQAFRADVLRRALDAPDDVLAAATDDAALVEAAGGSVRIVPAPPENIKITTPFDLRVAELLLAETPGV